MSCKVSESFRVGDLPTVYCVPEYVSATEEASLLREINGSRARWTQVSGRRVQSYGGSVTPKGLLVAPLPRWLAAQGERLANDTGVFGDGDDGAPARPNHVLMNAYRPGEGIMAHEDGPAYFPGVCILSLGAPTIMRFLRKRSGGSLESTMSVVLPPRSLLVFKDEAYAGCLHSIEAAEEDELDGTVANPQAAEALQPGAGKLRRGGERISLTVRRVQRVSKVLRLSGRE